MNDPVEAVAIKPAMVTGDMDCTRACVATILGLPVAQVPNFYRQAGDDSDMAAHSARMKQAMRDYLRVHGLAVFETYCNGAWLPTQAISWASEDNPGCPIILHGKPARSVEPAHSVVLLNGRIVHDPSGAGIAGPLDCDGQAWWFFDVICATAAARPLLFAEAWQPIETAPRDGTPLLLLIQGQWADGAPFIMHDVGHWHDRYGPGGSWVFRTPPNYLQGLDDGDAPTHWQPLPAPPRTAGSKSDD